jgi:hypothetical protein
MMTNAGYNKGLANRSKVERLGWAWKGASKNAVEKKLDSITAVEEARAESHKLTGKLWKAGQGTKADAVTVLVFAKKDDVGKFAAVEFFSARDASPDAADLEAMKSHNTHVPIGLVVVLLDREKKQLIVHARPWILEHPALKLMEEMVAKAADLKDWWVN